MTVYLPRIAQKIFELSSRGFGIACLNGPAGCGKTTFLRNMMKPEDVFWSMDDEALRQEAENDYSDFVRKRDSGEKRIIIDEVQRVHSLFAQVKHIVDEFDEIKGRFWFSASLNYFFMREMRTSMVGRLHPVRLRTLTESEIRGCDNTDLLEKLRNVDAGTYVFSSDECSRESMIRRAFIGGYPGIVLGKEDGRKAWFDRCLEDVFATELPDIRKFRKKDAVRRLLSAVAMRSGDMLNIRQLGLACGGSAGLCNRGLLAFQGLFLIDIVGSWFGLGWRIDKAVFWSLELKNDIRIYLTDSGLMCHLAGFDTWEDLKAWLGRAGAEGEAFVERLLKTWVYMQLAPHADTELGITGINHLTAPENRRADFFLDDGSNGLLAVNVKASETVGEADFEGLRWFKKKMGGQLARAIVFYCGSEVKDFGEGCIALPMAALWH